MAYYEGQDSNNNGVHSRGGDGDPDGPRVYSSYDFWSLPTRSLRLGKGGINKGGISEGADYPPVDFPTDQVDCSL